MSKKQTSMIAAMLLLLALSLSVPGFAQNANGEDNADASVINVYVDGTLLLPSGNSAQANEPLFYDGTVYLPLWAISEAIGKPIQWDSATNSLYIGEPAEIAEITVTTAEELISALGSNRRILLKEGVYNLTEMAPRYVNANIYYGERPDGAELFLDGIHNLTIQGIGEERSEIIVEPRYANVLNFLNCSNISMKNIKAGHTEGGTCSGGVFLFDNCTNIQIDDTDMYGCGTLGLSLESVRDFTVTGSTIYECTAGIMNAQRSSGLLFKDCVFRDNETYAFLASVEYSADVAFDSCSFLRNTNPSHMFYALGSVNISVENSEFIENATSSFAEQGEVMVDALTRFENNGFEAPRR